jgi:hypothetical protein
LRSSAARSAILSFFIAIEDTYRRGGIDDLIGLQTEANLLVGKLNTFRLRANFNGYEQSWGTSQAYQSFSERLPELLITKDKTLNRDFPEFIEEARNKRPSWYEGFGDLYDRNLERFCVLIDVSGVDPGQISDDVSDYFLEGAKDKYEKELRLLTDFGLRTAYLTESERDTMVRWMAKSFVILFSKRFGEDFKGKKR